MTTRAPSAKFSMVPWLAFAVLAALPLGSAGVESEELCLEEHSASTASALLQKTQAERTQSAERSTEEASKEEGAALRGRVDALETEVSSLQQRVAALEGNVGVSGGGGGGGAVPLPTPSPTEATPVEEEVPALMSRGRQWHGAWRARGLAAHAASSYSVPLKGSEQEKESDDVEDSFGDDESEASLLQSSVATEDESIKARVLSVESAMATLRSQVSTLENQVTGSTFNTKELGLLQSKIAGVGSESSLKARIVALEDEGDSLRTRVTSLEHVVTG